MAAICYERWTKDARKSGPRRRVLTSEQARWARAQYGAGASPKGLAMALGVTEPALYALLRWQTYRDAL